MTDKELTDGAALIARDLMLPNGRRLKLAKAVAPHLPWFVSARRRGLSWEDIIDVLFDAGVKRPNGLRLSRGHLSSLIPRKLQEQRAEPAPVHAASAGAQAMGLQRTPSLSSPITDMTRPSAVSRTPSSPRRVADQTTVSGQRLSPESAVKQRSSGQASLRARLGQAARARRDPGE